ncbi:glycosyltransferase family 4 protein [Arthrobacter sp. H41]|uniref:glycosyltransferase family 4 protein n=1 Tax=Arthrobacter sp. H41 TaxID=1312978 RepID=UPI0009DF7867|nr:glycosyltransferase family 4 protein [Arthrobacter sp. H41]
MKPSSPSRTAYVLKIYPRFSETFIVTEILAREAAGEELDIFSLRAPVDPRFHPELARVQAPVTYVTKPAKLSDGWGMMAAAHRAVPDFGARFADLLPSMVDMDPLDVHQGIELATLFSSRGITHAHAHFGSVAARTARIASALTGIPFSFTAHAKDIFHEEVDQPTLISLIGHAHHVVTVSDFNLAYLRSLAPDQSSAIHRVYNGLELDRFAYAPPSPPRDPFRVVAVGRLVEKKGFHLLLDAAAELIGSGMTLEVRIAGGGLLQEELEQQIHRLGMADAVTLLGPRTQQEVVDLLRWADVFVAPCVVGEDGNMDGLPTVLLEAMATGVPCIASDITGIPEVMADAAGRRTGLLIRSGVTADLVDALRFSASDTFDREGTASAARALIERCFDSRVQSDRLRELAADPRSTAVVPSGTATVPLSPAGMVDRLGGVPVRTS